MDKNYSLKIPTVGYNQQPMVYLRILADGSEQYITRKEMFELTDQPGAEEHLFPDFDGGYMYYCDEGNAELARFLKLDTDRNQKRYLRATQCAYLGTKKCRYWTKDENGYYDCSRCPYSSADVRRTIDMDNEATDEDGETVSGDTLYADTRDTPDIICEKKCEREILALVLASFSEKDQQYIKEAYADGMTPEKLAVKYGISRDATYKRTKRLTKRMAEEAKKYF